MYSIIKTKTIKITSNVAGKIIIIEKDIEQKNENLDFFLYYNTNFKTNLITKYNNFIYNEGDSIINGNIRQIGTESKNGFINTLTMKNTIDNKEFDIILKVSLNPEVDNIYYEYYVGMCVNKLKELAPNFVHTFNHLFLTEDVKTDILDKYNEIDSTTGETRKIYSNIDRLKSESVFTKSDINKLSDKKLLSKGCEQNKNSGIIIDNIPNSLSLDELLVDTDFLSDYEYNLFCVLFQLYGCLTKLKNVFTHYDLHYGNVMFIKLNEPITIEYKNEFDFNKLTYTIHTRFIPVIIDYGRLFVNCKLFSELTMINSSDFIQKACKNKDCNKYFNEYNNRCDLVDIGLHIWTDLWSHEFEDNSVYHYINSRVRNYSHDLHFLINIYRDIYNSQLWIELERLFNKTNNPEWFGEDEDIEIVGVKESENAFDYESKTGKIKTVEDLYVWFLTYYDANPLLNKPPPSKIIGTMRISMDMKTKWTFTPI